MWMLIPFPPAVPLARLQGSQCQSAVFSMCSVLEAQRAQRVPSPDPQIGKCALCGLPRGRQNVFLVRLHGDLIERFRAVS